LEENEEIFHQPSSEFEVDEGHKSGFVAVVGRPNVGKSTLINAFMKQKIAIVAPRPQTTRTRQLGIITEPEYQVIFMDTPGLIKPRHKLDEFMVETAAETLENADIVLWLVDSSELPGPGDQAIAQQLSSLNEEIIIILGMNKSDLLAPEDVLPRTETYKALVPKAKWVLFSATEGNGRDELYQMIIDSLPEGPRFYPVDQITDAFVRDIAAEMIREQVILQLREEIPHGTAVMIDQFKERSNDTVYIHATIYLERENHKKILIGAKGAQLRQIGEAARKEIEAMVEKKVFLELWVKVEPKWRRKANSLKRFGYRRQE